MAKRRRLKKKVKRFFLFMIILIISIVIIQILPSSHAFETATKYNDQYIDGIVFTDMEYYKNTFSYCHHVIREIDNSDLEYSFSFDNNQVKIDNLDDKKCDSIELEETPSDVSIIETTKNVKSVLSSEQKEESFNKCDNNNNFPYEESKALTEKINNLKTYLSKTSVGFYYENLVSDFSLGYNEDKVFYGASLVKLPSSLYLIDEAIKGNISLNDTVKLSGYYYDMGNKEMKTNKVGGQIELIKLIKYALETSDNGAHLLMFDTYVGKHLTEYEKSLGSPYPYTKGTDKFGYQTALATNVYLKRAYEIITTNEEYGPTLKKYMVNNTLNALDLKDGIEVAHKYGQITENPKFHDIGIVFNKHPYTISVLTYYSQSKGTSFINDLHKRVKEIHELYYEEKTEYCLNKAYFNN